MAGVLGTWLLISALTCWGAVEVGALLWTEAERDCWARNYALVAEGRAGPPEACG